MNDHDKFPSISFRFKLDGGGFYRPTDDDGRTDESGWEIHLLANRTYTASVRLCCESPTAQVTLDVNGTLLTLTDPDGNQVYEGTFTTPAVGPTVTSTLTVDCNGVTTESRSKVLIDPDGVVYDITTGAKLSGASVACLVQGATSAAFSAWPAESFGQVIPQTTDSDGYFAFFTPPGMYRLDVARAGYQPYRSPDLQVVATPVRHDVPLTPIVNEPAQVTVVIGENGFEPAMTKVAPGTVVKFINADVRNHSVKGTQNGRSGVAAASAVATGGFDSGGLGPGQRYSVKLNSSGTFTLSDASVANAAGALIVAPIDSWVLLPLVMTK